MARFKKNRRRFISQVTAPGAVFLCSRLLPAAKGVAPLRFVIVSDTHLGRKDNQSAERNWRKAISEINATDAEFVLHLGDVVDRGREAQYSVYTESRELLKKPIHEIPGNHDPVDLFERHIVRPIDRFVDYGGVRFLLFNNSRRDSHDGFISTRQLSWIEAQCRNADSNGLKVVICCHVPIHSNRHPDRGWYVKPDEGQNAFYQLQSRFRDCILAGFHGHFHNGIRGWQDHRGMVESLMPSVCYNQNRGLAGHLADGTASGFFVDELRPGFVVAALGAGRLTLHYKPLGQSQQGEFVAKWPANR